MRALPTGPTTANGASEWRWHDLPLVLLLAAGVALGHVLGYSAAGVVHPDGHVHFDHAFPFLTAGGLIAFIVLVGRLGCLGVAVRPSARRFVAAHITSYLVLEIGEHFASHGGQALLSRQVLFGLLAQIVVALAIRRLVVVAGEALARLVVPAVRALLQSRHLSRLTPTSDYIPISSSFSTSRVSRGPPMGLVTAIT